jgi:Sec-independent protein translocase protein TatA
MVNIIIWLVVALVVIVLLGSENSSSKTIQTIAIY